jgi:BlaI family transcriptional regulator, penicillinase repressor
MSRTPQELTQRELEVMHVFWTHGELTASMARDYLANDGRDLTYTTVANLIRILYEKNFLRQLNGERPFVYAPARSREHVSKRLLGDMLDNVFKGSREQLLLRLFEQRQLTDEERRLLTAILKESTR